MMLISGLGVNLGFVIIIRRSCLVCCWFLLSSESFSVFSGFPSSTNLTFLYSTWMSEGHRFVQLQCYVLPSLYKENTVKSRLYPPPPSCPMVGFVVWTPHPSGNSSLAEVMLSFKTFGFKDHLPFWISNNRPLWGGGGGEACSPCMGLHSSAGRALQCIHRGHGFDSRWSPRIFFFSGLIHNCLNCDTTAMVTSSFHFS